MSADDSSTATDGQIRFRTSHLDDAHEIWSLVRHSGGLELNSCYCYLLLCRDFAQTCVVAHHEERMLGFVIAYRPPDRNDVIFVWQIGTAVQARRRGLARRLLHELVSLPACQEVEFLEATVSQSNRASRRLFESFAQDRGVPCRVAQGFTAEMFGNGVHEPEELFRIGPLRP